MTPLVLLPILWLALTGTRRDVVAALAAATFMLQPFLVGRPPTSSTTGAARCSAIVHRQMRRLDSGTRWVADAAAAMDGILRESG